MKNTADTLVESDNSDEISISLLFDVSEAVLHLGLDAL